MARSGGGPGSRRRGSPTISLDNRKTSIFAPTTGVFWAVYKAKMYLCLWLRPEPTQPGSSYYCLLTTPWPGAQHWLLKLTGVLMSNVLTQNFGRMSFGGLFLAGGPGLRTCVPCLLVNPAMLGAPLQLGAALSVRSVRLWVNPALSGTLSNTDVCKR